MALASSRCAGAGLRTSSYAPAFKRASRIRSLHLFVPALTSRGVHPVLSDRTPAKMPQARASAVDQAMPSSSKDTWQPNEPTYICTSVTADSVQGALGEIQEATAAGVDVIELRLDYIKEFDPQMDLKTLMDACKVPYIVTYRPTWEG